MLTRCPLGMMGVETNVEIDVEIDVEFQTRPDEC